LISGYQLGCGRLYGIDKGKLRIREVLPLASLSEQPGPYAFPNRETLLQPIRRDDVTAVGNRLAGPQDAIAADITSATSDELPGVVFVAAAKKRHSSATRRGRAAADRVVCGRRKKTRFHAAVHDRML
jgi:hypothetical protein